MQERAGERGMLTLIWADGTRLVFAPASNVNRINQTLTLPHNATLLDLLDSGEVSVSFGPSLVSEHIGLSKARPRRAGRPVVGSAP